MDTNSTFFKFSLSTIESIGRGAGILNIFSCDGYAESVSQKWACVYSFAVWVCILIHHQRNTE